MLSPRLFFVLSLPLVACDPPAPHEAPPPAGCSPGMVQIDDRKGTTFCLDAGSVTVAAYHECVGRALCSAPDQGRGCLRDDLPTQQKPVNCVDFAQADAYCKAQQKRLPSLDELQTALWASTPGQVSSGGQPEWTSSRGSGPQRMALRFEPHSRQGMMPAPVDETARGSLGFRCVR